MAQIFPLHGSSIHFSIALVLTKSVCSMAQILFFLLCIYLQGAGIGLICSLVVCFWIGVGSILNPVSRVKLPNSIIDCASSTKLLTNDSLNGIINVTTHLLNTSVPETVVNTTVPYVMLKSDIDMVTLLKNNNVYSTVNSSLTPVVPIRNPER